MRLDKFISSQRGDISRSDAGKLCRKGAVTVNGTPVRKPDFRINENTDAVCLNGESISYSKFVYIMLNKPAGYVCSTKEGNSPTVLSLVPPQWRRKGLFPAGRLDKDTEGLVLITDDGELAHRMLSPKHHVPKKYFVRLEKPVGSDYAEIFASGMEIDGGDICRPARLIPLENDPHTCYVVVHEGMYHQIKRMFEKVGNKVVYLKRISMGKLVLDENLPLGKCLWILHKDVESFL